jgi:hypothetical protein
MEISPDLPRSPYNKRLGEIPGGTSRISRMRFGKSRKEATVFEKEVAKLKEGIRKAAAERTAKVFPGSQENLLYQNL